MKDIRAIIFDLGGTLINYEGIPLYWGDYYINAFENVKKNLTLELSNKQIFESIEILKKYNPRLYPREIEYESEYIFSHVTQGWNIKANDIADIVKNFFAFFRKNVIVYPDTLEVLQWLKGQSYKTGILTDVPTGMSEELVDMDICSFKSMIDYCISSIKCGYRKPNKSGLDMLSKLLDTKVTNMIFIGDEEKDIFTAKNAGCISILLNRNGLKKEYGQDYEISSIMEIINILK